MVELTIYDYLKDALDVPVYMMRPEDVPDEYVILEKTGSSVTDHIQSAVFAVQSYAPTLYAAAVLNEAVKTAMDDALNLTDISKVTLNSDYNFTDPSAKQPRYQALFEVVFF